MNLGFTVIEPKQHEILDKSSLPYGSFRDGVKPAARASEC